MRQGPGGGTNCNMRNADREQWPLMASRAAVLGGAAGFSRFSRHLLFSTLHPRPIDAWTRIGVAIYAAWR